MILISYKKTLPLLSLVTILCLFTSAVRGQESDLGIFFQSYVDDGLVNYSEIDTDQLSILIKKVQSQITTPLDKSDETKSNLINLYNLLVIDQVVKNYPVNSVMQVSGFFDNKVISLQGRDISLNTLEKDILLKNFPDARLHFALNCGAVGCPPLSSLPFTPENIEQQLEELTKSFINDPDQTLIDSKEQKIGLSEIFRWYTSDFTSGGTMKDFLSPYITEDLSSYDFYYYPYDWSLNEKTNAVFTNQNQIQPYRVSNLYRKGQNEFKLWNGIWSELYNDGQYTENLRSSYMSSFLQVLLGSDKNINYGADLIFKSNVQNELASRGIFAPLHLKKTSQLTTHDGVTVTDRYDQPVYTYYDYGVSHIGPKIKLPISKKLPSLILQQTFFLPIQKSVDGTYVSFTQFFYDKLIGTNQQLFIEASSWLAYKDEFQPNFYFKAFYSYFPHPKFTLYATGVIPAEVGLGAKYFITPHIEIEILGTKYIPVGTYENRNVSTINLGLRYNN